MLRARLNLQGTIMGFTTERSDRLWWLMVSGDANATRLLLLLSEFTLWPEDVGRVARGALARQQRGHWDTTVANAWGAVALRRRRRVRGRAGHRRHRRRPRPGGAADGVGRRAPPPCTSTGRRTPPS
ncbi:MAG: hypothetical protein U0802_24215 [Candidatus Binatia bacterium]